MRTAIRLMAFVAAFICSASLASHAQSKSKKHPLPQPLPSLLPFGPTGPLPQMPLDAMPPEPPQVNYRDGELTIVAPNSTLADILRCVREQTAAEIEIPVVTERVVTRLGPGPVSEILSELLNGSHFNYVLLGSPGEPTRLTKVVLLAKAQPAAAIPIQPGAPRSVPPAQPLAGVNVEDRRAFDQGASANQTDMPSEVTPPPPTDGPVDSSD